MKQNWLPLLLVLALLISMFAACGSQSAAEVSEQGSASTSEAVEDAADKTEEPAPVQETGTEEAEEPEEAERDEEAVPAEPEKELTGDEALDYDWGEYTADLPLTDEGITFTYWMGTQPFMMTYGGSIDYNTLPFYAAMEELTGVHLDLNVLSMQSSMEQFNLMFATGDYPDMFEGEYTSGAQQGIADDVIVPLEDYLDEYMPNYKAWLEAKEDVRALVTTDDDHVYCAANIYLNNPGQIQGPMLRGDWLEETGLNLPETYDELHDVLVAFHENGHLGALWMTSALQVPFDCWSAGYDVLNGNLVRDGKIVYGLIDDGYRDYITMLREWYVEGLVYKDFTSVSQYADSIDTGLVLDGTVGVFVGDTTRMETLESDGGVQLSAFPYPVKNAGDITHIAKNNDIVGQGTTISTACQYPEIACQYLDYLYTYDGFILSNYGEEGVAFEYDDNGVPNLTDLVIHNENFITPVGFILYTKFSGAGICDNRRSTLAYTERNFADMEIWASNTGNDHMLPMSSILNAEEATESYTITSDVDTYVQENLLRFVVGDRDLSEWDDYVADIKAMGIDRAIEIYQGAYDRYIQK